MPMDKATRAAIKNAEVQAKQILEARKKVREVRSKAVAAHVKSLKAAVVSAKALPVAAAAMTSVGTLVAEGDSWFDYPFFDILKILQDKHGFDVESVAHMGDAIEQMAYEGNQLEDFVRSIEKLLRRDVTPKAILLSGGGNDVAGNEFAMLLNHSKSTVRGLNNQVVDGILNQRIRTAYVDILTRITTVCKDHLGAPIPILVHGYGYPVPDGRGYLGGFWILPGPWLEPGFRQKGYEDMKERIAMAKDLIDRFNSMLQEVAALPPFAHVKYINLRKVLSNGADYRTFWGNELHPTQRGFDDVTDRFVEVLGQL